MKDKNSLFVVFIIYLLVGIGIASLAEDGSFGDNLKSNVVGIFNAATVEHASRGEAKVIVRGTTRGRIQAPGETVVFI